MVPRLSDGWPHSAASQVSLKSSQRTWVPMLNAAWAGSSSNEVPGTRAPPGISPPGTSGPRCFTQPSRSEEHTSELQSLMRNSYAVFGLKKKNKKKHDKDE